MKKFILPVLLLVLAACHHDNNNNNTQTQTTSTPGGQPGPNIPSGAAGALYAVNEAVYSNNGSGYDTTGLGLAYGWFVNSTTTKDAGSVVVNGDTLYITDPTLGTSFPWYELGLLQTGQLSFPTNAVAWGVQGNSANGVPAFNYTDNTAFPVVNGLTIPYPVNISNGLTVHFTVSGAYDAIFYTISGQGQSSLSFTGSSATTATFSATQLSQVVSSGGNLGVQIMPIKLTPYTVSGKTYYFVKQNAFNVTSPVQ
jgi:hypothetical protein